MQWLLMAILVSIPCAAHGWEADAFHLSKSAKFSVGMDWSCLWISGEMLVPAGGQPGSGSAVELASDLGLYQGDGTSVFLDGTVAENHLLRLDYLMCLPNAVAKPRKAFRFQNRTYLEGTPVEAKLDVNWLRFSYGYRAWAGDSWFVAPRLGVHYIHFAAKVNGETVEEGIASNTRALDATYPVLGFEARFLTPYGIDFGLEAEGVHMIYTGFLGMARLSGRWEVHPDVTLTMGVSSRFVERCEDNQPLNNRWLLGLTSWTAGVSFGF
jgi:hypothetical protein